MIKIHTKSQSKMISISLNQWETGYFLSIPELWEHRFDNDHCQVEIYKDKKNERFWRSTIHMSDKFAELFLFYVPRGTLRDTINLQVKSRVITNQWNPKHDILRR